MGSTLHAIADFISNQWEIFVITGAATFAATLPAVYLGLKWERAEARRKEREDFRRGLNIIAEPGGIGYETRDWSNNMRSLIENAQPLNYTSRQPTSKSIEWLISVVPLPTDYLTSVAQLLDQVYTLEKLITPRLGQLVADTDSAYTQILDLGNRISEYSQLLIDLAIKDKRRH